VQAAVDGRRFAFPAYVDRAGRIAIAVGFGLALVAITAVLAVGWQPFSALGLIIGTLLVIGFALRAFRRARLCRLERALEAWGRPRGFLFVERHGNPSATPLLRRTGLLGPALIGPVGGDPHGLLAHCRTTLVDGRDDRDGDPFSVAIARLSRIDGLGLRIGVHQQWTANALDDWHRLPTESLEIDERFVIEVRAGQDQVRVRSLLEPGVLAAMLEDDAAIGVEIEDGWLVVWQRGNVDPSEGVARFERLLAQAARWERRLRDAPS